MEQVKRNIPYGLFIALGLKLLILGTSNLYDVLALLVLGCGLAFFELRIENKKIQELSNEINKLDKTLQEKSAKLEDLSKSLSSIRMAQGIKPVTMNKF